MEAISLILQQLKKQGKFTLKTDGISMLPLLQPNDLISYRRISFKQCRINDLLMAKKGRKILTHRIIYKNKKYLITKGDNNLQADGKIYPEQIIARVYQIKRNREIFSPESLYLLQSTLYFQEISKIKQAFENERINFVFLKGLPLHLYFEKCHPKRIYADCDVLVAKKDYHSAEKVLDRFGYQKTETAFSSIHQLLKDKPTEYVFYKKINNFGVSFDLHLEVAFLMNQLGKLEALYPQRLIDEMTVHFLQEKQTVEIQDQPFPILSSINLIIYLALHFFHHNYRGVFRLEFLDKVIRKVIKIPSPRGNPCMLAAPEVSSGLSEIICKYRLQNFVYPVFLFLKKYYQTPLPDLFLNSIKPDKRKLNYIRKNILNINIFNDETRIKAGINRFKNIFYLSPYPLIRKIWVFFNPQVIYSVFWAMIFLFKRSFINSSKSFRALTS